MNDVLLNPVYHALLTGDQHLSFGTEHVKHFDLQVSPFVGFDRDYDKGFSDLHELFPAGREILFATPVAIAVPDGWKLTQEIKGLQFVFEKGHMINNDFNHVIPLSNQHIGQMMHLAAVTKPGPFGLRTIDFGSYFGIFEGEILVAMAGQRLHVHDYTEISAVCTLPGFTGKGYAHTLLQHQLQLILQQGQRPFLHVRDDNSRAIDLYERTGFTISRPMIFYFFQRE